MRLSRTTQGAVLLAGAVAALTVGCTEWSDRPTAESDAPASSVAPATTMQAPQGEST